MKVLMVTVASEVLRIPVSCNYVRMHPLFAATDMQLTVRLSNSQKELLFWQCASDVLQGKLMRNSFPLTLEDLHAGTQQLAHKHFQVCSLVALGCHTA